MMPIDGEVYWPDRDTNVAATPSLREVCRSCGEPWATHLGIFGTCAKLQVAIRALQEIVDVTATAVNPLTREKTIRLRIAVKAAKALKEIEG